MTPHTLTQAASEAKLMLGANAPRPAWRKRGIESGFADGGLFVGPTAGPAATGESYVTLRTSYDGCRIFATNKCSGISHRDLHVFHHQQASVNLGKFEPIFLLLLVAYLINLGVKTPIFEDKTLNSKEMFYSNPNCVQ